MAYMYIYGTIVVVIIDYKKSVVTVYGTHVCMYLYVQYLLCECIHVLTLA
jgi:hypothetical protein